MRVKLKEEAQEDLLAGSNFYRERNPSTGDYFLHSVQADIEELAWQGGIHATANGYHLKRAHRFPFGIYYVIDNGVVEVVAVLDLRGHPQALRRRLNQRR